MCQARNTQSNAAWACNSTPSPSAALPAHPTRLCLGDGEVGGDRARVVLGDPGAVAHGGLQQVHLAAVALVRAPGGEGEGDGGERRRWKGSG